MKNWYQRHTENLGWVERIEDAVANFCGSLSFFMLHIAWFALWILLRVEAFPFGLLTMIVSLESILLSTIIMMSQNRSGERDRAEAEHSYIDVRMAKQEVEDIQHNLGRMEMQKLDKLLQYMQILIERTNPKDNHVD